MNPVAIENKLLELLKARTGPPKPAAKLTTVNHPQSATTGKRLTKAQILPLTGHYSSDGDVVTVREFDSRLEVTHPLWGSYFLLSRTATEFVAEDAQKRIDFELDGTESATAIRIWFNPAEPCVMRRVGGHNLDK